MELPTIHRPSLPVPTPVVPGTVLFDNAPGGVLIKPEPVALESGGLLGPAAGWATLDDAIAGAAQLTAWTPGSAAVVRDGARFVVHELLSWGEPRGLSMPVSNFGGVRWVHPDVVAFVDGAWVERIQHHAG